MNTNTVVICLLAPFALFGFLGVARAAWLTVKHLKAAKLRAHPLAMRGNTPAAPGLMDEPPAACPHCGTSMVTVARADFQPDGETFKLPATEHFGCENGHRWFGLNQKASLEKRISIRKGLKVVSVDAPTADRPVVKALTAEERLAEKVKQLDLKPEGS